MFKKIFIFLFFVKLLNGFNEIQNKLTDGDVMLVDGGSKKEGTVLVFLGYGWGSICDDHWTFNEANVICKQLGMEKAVRFYKRNYFQSDGIKNYFMDDVVCNGNETKISECQFRGWGNHDCRTNEHVGVQCFKIPENRREHNWNPLNIPLPKLTLLKYRKNKFKVTVEHNNEISTGIVVTEINGVKYPLCPQNFGNAEHNVLCREIRGLFGGILDIVPLDTKKYIHGKYIARVGRCYGNESSLLQCLTYANLDGVSCNSEKMIRINCTSELPDIRADYSEIERSSYMERLNLWHLQCALTEKCLPDSVYKVMKLYPNSYFWLSRTLLRFSSIIENIGNTSFLPLESPEKWEWHGCHLHYHSMKLFAVYEIIDSKSNVIATGQKSSFCLEDNLCSHDVIPLFKCGNTMYNKGTQGISPGCKDTYLHEYDCQWIDITEITPGTYTFQMIINPFFHVGESDYFNNGMSCTMYFMGYNAVLRSCSWKHPYDLL